MNNVVLMRKATFRLLTLSLLLFLAYLAGILFYVLSSTSEQLEIFNRIETWTYDKWVTYDANSAFWQSLQSSVNAFSEALSQPTYDEALICPGTQFTTCYAGHPNGATVRQGLRGPIDINYDFGVLTETDDSGADIELHREVLGRLRAFVKRLRAMYWNTRSAKSGSSEFGQNNPHSAMMMEVLGLGPRADFPELGISWIYVGSSIGSYVTYPGNSSFIDGKYDPRKRPWYQSAMGRQPYESISPIGETGISYLYGDYSSELTALNQESVRTVWKRVTFGKVTYVIGIDFLLFGDRKNLGGSVFNNIRSTLAEGLRNAGRLAITGGLALLVVVALILLVMVGMGRSELAKVFVFSSSQPTSSSITLIRRGFAFSQLGPSVVKLRRGYSSARTKSKSRISEWVVGVSAAVKGLSIAR